MSKIRMRIKLANDEQYTVDENGYYVFEDGTVIDPETGEVMQEGNKGNWQDGLKDIMFEEKSQAYKDYPDEQYKNIWGKVSPLNVLMVDRLNELYGMDVQTAKNTIIETIEEMNRKYGHNDDSYSYMSKEYINTFKMNLNKMKTTKKVVDYLSNAYFKGMNMGMNNGRYAVTLDLNNKELLARILPGLKAIANLK